MVHRPGRHQKVFSSYTTRMRYALRSVPEHVDAALRRVAREQGKSLNEVAIEALARGAGVTERPSQRRDLKDIAGTWRTNREIDGALADQDTIDAELWK